MAENNEEFTRLFVRYRGMLSSYVLSLVHDPNLAEDVLQDVAVSLMKKFDSFDGKGFGGWARRIAKWHVLNHWRSESRRLSACQALKQSTLELLDDCFEQNETAFFEWEVRKQALSECQQQLPPGVKALLDLRYGRGLPIAHIAENLGKQSAAVQVALSRTRERLMECVKHKLATLDHAL